MSETPEPVGIVAYDLTPAIPARYIGDDVDVAATNARIGAYDLEPPGDRGRTSSFTPLRDAIKHVRPEPRYLPPPVPEGHVRVQLDDDYYTGPYWSDWSGQDERNPSRVFDVPAEQRDRWLKAKADYDAMQEEIEALRSARAATPGDAPEGWTLKPGYQVQP